MTETAHSRPRAGHWLLLLMMAGWLAAVPLAVTAALQALSNSPPELLVQVGLAVPQEAVQPEWGTGLLSIALTLGLNLLLFLPVYFATRKHRGELAHVTATLLLGITAFQTLNALALLPSEWAVEGQPGSLPAGLLISSALRLLLGLAFLLLGLGWIEAKRLDLSLRGAWRRVGLRLWFNPSAFWLALACGAFIAWPWVVSGSLGSPGTTAASLLQALPNGLNEEILFRGFAFAWLWRAARGRTRGAVASLILFVAAQGATVLPYGDWGALPRFASALFLGILCLELTVRAGGSIWPAVVVHLLYDWFRYAFVDPRFLEEVLLWAARVWAPLAAGALGMLLWIGRKVAAAVRGGTTTPRPVRAVGTAVAGILAFWAWAGVAVLYLSAGAPGFHPDGFLIFLEEQADLSPAASIADPVERRAWVYVTLVDTAERSQAPIRAELDRRGVPYRSHYLINMIEVQSRPGLRRAFADEPGVASVQFQPGVRRIPYPTGIPNADTTGPSGVEWNVEAVGANRVWELGFTGQGVIVGSADSGVAWDHPALKGAYLGWDGAVADHEYHWYDPWDGSTEASDDNGHGTHTTGTMVGLDGENEIGVAPGAQWIACRNMRYGLGNPGSYVGCMEFLLAPFRFGGDPLHDGVPGRGAQVVNNSWGCPPEEGCLPDTLRIAVENLRAAGQMLVASAGNYGPACGTVTDPPAVYDDALTVGAIYRNGQATSFSSRGPVEVGLETGLLKPELAAPGFDIRSAVPGGYASLPGTSMAGPHVAGAVALLWSADPALMGDLDRTEELLLESAQQRTVDASCTERAVTPSLVCGCGDDGPSSVPNNVYGWGLLDVRAAVKRVLEGR
jgi:subtilisin family serine protease